MRKRLILFGVGFVISGVALAVGLKVKGVHSQTSPPCTSHWVTALQHGIESEAPCPTSLANFSSAVSNLSFFTRYRCGFSLSNAVQQRLVQLEQEAWPGNCDGLCRLTRQDIKNILTAEFLSIASRFTDAQITTLSQSFQVVPAWAPSNRSPDVMLDSSGPNVTQADFTQSAQLLRRGDPTATAAATVQISSQVDHICHVLAYALPSDWDVTYYSPYQVYVIAYYLASGDKLADSYAECETRMSNTQNWLSSQGFNVSYEGKTPWGDAGYIYRRPTSILFNDAVQSDLLNLYAAVHGLQ